MATQQLMQSPSAVDDDSTALFHSSPYPLYYIQSPSTTSHSTISTAIAAIPPPSSDSGAFLSPTRGRLTLSLYSSSSRGSNNDSFVEEKKHEMMELKGEISSSNVVEEEEEEMSDGGIRRRRRKRRGLMEKLVVLDSNESLCCVVFQFGWRIMVSLALALLVFFLATNPPEPEFSFKIINVRHFSLGEGLDDRGVPTKVLSCNCSVDMEVVNKSKFFGLHIHPPVLEMDFGSLKFASSQSQASYVESTSSSIRRLFIGVKNKPMYGAGRSMEDLLESERGLLLMIQIRTQTSYRVVWDLIKIKHHHLENCIIILQAMHDPKLYAKMYNSSCFQA